MPMKVTGFLPVVAAIFLVVWLASLHASSAGSATSMVPAAGHLLYTSEEGPPDGAAVPVLSLHPVHGAEVRRWTQQQHNLSSDA